MMSVFVEGVHVEALVDTGATLSVMHSDLCRRLRKVTTPYDGPALVAAQGKTIRPSAFCTVRVSIDGIVHYIQFAVLSPCSHQLILGWDFLASASAAICCGQGVVHMTDTDYSLGDEPYQPLRLLAAKDTELPPRCQQILTITSDAIDHGDVLVLPCARWLTKGIAIVSGLVRFDNGSALLEARNTTPEKILLPKGTTLACVADSEPLSVVPLKAAPSEIPPAGHSASTSALAAVISSDLTPSQTQQLLALLKKHEGSFDAHSSTLGQTTVTAHRIQTDGRSIVRRRPYRVSLAERKIIEQNVADMLQREIIRPSASPWSSPIVLVRKKDGSVRFCVDYRALNKITRKDVYPMPRIDDALDSLQGAEYFSSLDLRSGYWQIPMHEADKEKTAFATPDGLYEFNVMPFGLCNAPATFERMIDTVLRGLKWKTCLCYLDDIVIFSSTFAQHLQRLDEVLTCIASAGLQLNTKKCHFASKMIKVLGHIVSKDGIRPDPDKISVVLPFLVQKRPRTYAVSSASLPIFADLFAISPL